MSHFMKDLRAVSKGSVQGKDLPESKYSWRENMVLDGASTKTGYWDGGKLDTKKTNSPNRRMPWEHTGDGVYPSKPKAKHPRGTV